MQADSPLPDWAMATIKSLSPWYSPQDPATPPWR